MPEVMNTAECVMTVEYCWVKSDTIQELLWVFSPDSANALLVQGMTNGRVIRYRLDPIGYGIEEIPEFTCLAFPSMYSEYQSLYVDCYVTRVWHTITLVRQKISAILNRVSMKQGSEFCVYRHNQVIHMSPDGWGYIHRRLLKLGVSQLEDYVTKRAIGDLRGHDLSYHSLRQTSEWIHFCLHTAEEVSHLKSVLGKHIWAGARKNRPKIDTPAKSLSVNDAWNVVLPRPTSDTPNPPGVSYGKYDLLFEPTHCAFKIWIKYKKMSSI
jgi:hypothetical protein